MMADDLKEGLARLAQSVVPQPEPYRRLLDRSRRQRRRRLAVTGAGAAMLVAAAVAIPALGPMPAPPGGAAASPRSDPAQFQPAAPIDTPLVQRLLNSPTRGSAPTQRAIDSIALGYLASRTDLLVDPALDRVKVLFAYDLPVGRVVVVAFHNNTHALIRTAIADSGAGVYDLIAKTGTPDQPQSLEAFVVLTQSSSGDGHLADYQLALAPSGCVAHTSSDGRLNLDATVVRSWQATGTDGFIVRGGEGPGERWRFTCDGVVRFNKSAVGRTMQVPRPDPPPISTEGARGDVDPRIAAHAARQLTEQLANNGMAAAPSRVLWGGRIPAAPAGTRPAALVTACYPGGGCAALLQVDTGAGPASDPMAGWRTAVGRSDLVAARLPDSTGKVLVVGPESAARAELLGPDGRSLAAGPLDHGVAVLHPRPGDITTIKVYDAAGRLIQAMPAAPELGSVRFGEPSVWDR